MASENNYYDYPLSPEEKIWAEAFKAGENKGRFDGYKAGEKAGYIEGVADGRSKGYADGRVIGNIEGKTEGIVKVAKAMLASGMDIAQISALTGLTDKQVRDLSIG